MAATASPTVTSHGRPVPWAYGGAGVGKLWALQAGGLPHLVDCPAHSLFGSGQR